MNRFILGIIFLVFINGFVADEIDIRIAYKNSNVFNNFLKRIFPERNHEKEENAQSPQSESDEINKDENSYDREHHHSRYCHVCIVRVKHFEILLDKIKKPEDVREAFLKRCDILKSPYREMCIKFYKVKGLDLIEDLLNGVEAKKVCEHLHICGHRLEESEFGDILEDIDIHSLITDISKKENKCKRCLKLTKLLERVMDTSKSLTFVTKHLTSMCNVFKPKYQKGCNNYFKKATVIQYIKSILAQESVYEICQNDGLCHKKEEPSNQDTGSSVDRSDHHHHKFWCKACRTVVNIYEIVLNHSKSPKTVQAVFLATCDILKPDRRAACIKFYRGKGLEILKAILNGIDSRLICQNIHICRRRSETSDIEKIVEDVHHYIGNIARKGYECKFCQKFTRYLEDVIDSSKSLSFILGKIATICTIYKDKYQTGCKEYFRNAKVVQYYKSVLAHKCPYLICRHSGACQKNDEKLRLGDTKDIAEPKESLSDCKLCQQIAYIYGTLTTDKINMETLSSVYHNVCKFVPGENKIQCLQFLKDHGEELEEKLRPSDNHDVVCSDMGMCSVGDNSRMSEEIPVSPSDSDSESKVPNILKKICDNFPERHRKDCLIFARKHSNKIKTGTGNFECMLCKKIIEQLDKNIFKNPNKEEIERALGNVCSLLPHIWRGHCEAWVKRFTEQIVHDIIAGVIPEEICRMLALCDSKEISSEDTKYFLPKFKIL